MRVTRQGQCDVFIGRVLDVFVPVGGIVRQENFHYRIAKRRIGFVKIAVSLKRWITDILDSDQRDRIVATAQHLRRIVEHPPAHGALHGLQIVKISAFGVRGRP